MIVSAIYAGTHVLVQLLFTPLLAGWAIWVGIAVSARSTDVRAAQQLSVLAGVPPLIILALMSLNVITVSTVLALGLAAALLAIDDREDPTRNAALGWHADAIGNLAGRIVRAAGQHDRVDALGVAA